METLRNRRHRVLIVDDNPSIHNDFRTVLSDEEEDINFNEKAELLFGEDVTTRPSENKLSVELFFATQGKEAFEIVKQSVQQKKPFAVAFIDVRMPPGWDGITTIEHLWSVDPDIQVVICTAYSDFSWNDMVERLGRNDSFFLLKKPFDNAEVSQITAALTRKWETTFNSRKNSIELQKLVEEKTKQLDKVLERANNSSSDNTELLVAVNRAIHSSIDFITTATDKLKEGNISSEQLKNIETILSSTESLSQIANDALDISRIENGTHEIESVQYHLKEIIESSFSMLSRRATELHNLSFVYSTHNIPSTFFNGDPNRIRRILINLISDAFLHATSDEVVVDVSYLNSVLSVIVKTEGMNINLGEKDPNFGFLLAKKFARMMGGNITSKWVNNNEFQLDLRLQLRSKPESDRPSIPIGYNDLIDLRELPREKVILLIENDRIRQNNIAEMLKPAGCLLNIAENNRAALEMVSTTFYDLILMDVSVPQSDGLSIAKEIRSIEKKFGKRSYIVGMVNAMDRLGQERCKRSGIDDFLTKPVKEIQLRDLLKRLESLSLKGGKDEANPVSIKK